MREQVEGKQFVWHHLTSFHEEDLVFLRDHFQFHHLDFDDLQSENPIPKADLYKHYGFIVFHIPRWDGAARIVTDDLEVFLGADYLITVTKRPIDALERLFLRIKQNPKLRAEVLGRSPSYTLYRLLRAAFAQAQDLVAELVRQVAAVEESVWDVRDRTTTYSLAHIRRNVLFLRTSIDPQRSLLLQMERLERPYVPEDAAVYLDDVRDILDTTWIISENVKQSVDGLFEVNETLISSRTNQVITIFTIVTAALMPPALIAGFYGMNVSWLPFVAHPGIVVALFGVSISCFAIIWWVLYRKK